MRPIIVAGYLPDRWESMDRFASLLLEGYGAIGLSPSLIRPEPRFGSMKRGGAGLGKNLGYLDKFMVFPLHLKKVARSSPDAVFHICDHSNAMYALQVRSHPTVVTVHDLLAVLGALGLQTDCPASRFGKILQRWILRGLASATMMTCDTTATRDDLLRLLPGLDPSLCPIIPVPLATDYRILPGGEVDRRLRVASLEKLIEGPPWLLHVGSNQPRKNKPALLRAFAVRIASGWNGRLVMAGPTLAPEHDQLARELGVRDRLEIVTGPSNETLAALYARCHAFCFPSRAEGFGWPLAEAQACGAPVVSTDISPCREVAADSALYHDPNDPEALAACLAELENPARRTSLAATGLVNARRFALPAIAAAFRDVCLRAAELHHRKHQ